MHIGELYVDTEHTNIVQVENSHVLINRLDGTFKPAQNNGAVAIISDKSEIEITNGNLHLSGNTNAHVIVKHNSTLTKARLSLKLTGVKSRLSYLASSLPHYDIESDLDVLLDGMVNEAPFLGYALNPKVRAKIKVGYNQRPLAYRNISYDTDGVKHLNLEFAGDESIYSRVEVSVGDVTINSITQGAFPGQKLIINNRNTSSATLKIKSSSTGKIILSAPIDISIGQGTILIWDGANWRSAGSW